MTDDQATTDWLEPMPSVRRHIVDPGVQFTNSFVTTPLCCPSRATLLTGQYAHNHGVRENDPGYPALREPESVLPAWLQAAGYRTGHVGKWLHRYERVSGTQGGTTPPPGWDEWDGFLSARYYDYDLSVNGVVRHFGQEPADYANDVITDHALRFLRQTGSEPFFLSLAYLAPHTDEAEPAAAGSCAGFAVPAPTDLPALDEPGFPRSAAVDEADVSDKPGFVRVLPSLGVEGTAAIDMAFRCEQAALRSVDDGVDRVMEELRRRGALRQTAVIFTSDNGFLHGEHRIDGGKSLAYDAATRVPLAIRPPAGPGDRAGVAAADALVANIDLAPTILDYAGTEPCLADGRCRRLDGRSLRPFMEGRARRWPERRAIVLESEKHVRGLCGWSGLRTRRFLYASYRAAGSDHRCHRAPAEVYDVKADPDQLDSVGDSHEYAAARRALRERLNALRHCAGRGCTDVGRPVAHSRLAWPGGREH